jgi:cation:H+ antiporter
MRAMMYLFLLGGFALLVVGGGMLVRGAAALARRLNVSAVLVGMFIVGFGTSAPELMICIDAALAGQTSLALGNVIGSNIANVLLVLGVCALVAPLYVAPRTVYRDGLVMLVGTVGFAGLALTGVIGLVEGAVLLGLMLVYSGYAAWAERYGGDPAASVHAHEAEVMEDGPESLGASLAFLGAGLAGVLIGAELVVDGAIDIARAFAVPEVLIGLTVVALGTSLPELSTGIIAAMKRQHDVIIGNVLGSNLFNLFAIMGATAMVRPVEVPASVATTDIWVMTGVMGLFVVLLVTGWKLSRPEGGLLLALYVGYMAFLVVGG